MHTKDEFSNFDLTEFINTPTLRLPERRIDLSNFFKPAGVEIPEINIPEYQPSEETFERQLSFQEQLTASTRPAFFNNRLLSDINQRENFQHISLNLEKNYGQPVFHTIESTFMQKMWLLFVAPKSEASVWYPVPQELFRKIAELFDKVEKQEEEQTRPLAISG